MKLETLAVHAGHAPDPATGAVREPIHLSTTFERGPDGQYPHGYFYSRSGNQYRDQGIKVLRSQVATYWPVINRYSIERVNISHRQHFEILSACEERKPVEAARLMQRHLEGTVPWIIEHLKMVHHEAGKGKVRGERAIAGTAETRGGRRSGRAIADIES